MYLLLYKTSIIHCFGEKRWTAQGRAPRGPSPTAHFVMSNSPGPNRIFCYQPNPPFQTPSPSTRFIIVRTPTPAPRPGLRHRAAPQVLPYLPPLPPAPASSRRSLARSQRCSRLSLSPCIATQLQLGGSPRWQARSVGIRVEVPCVNRAAAVLASLTARRIQGAASGDV
jgi:hypothetical protein